MSTPLTATDRVVLTYQVLGLQHRLVSYCSQGAPISGEPSLITRDGSSTIVWNLLAQFQWEVLRSLLDPSTPPASAQLETRSGIIWNPVSGQSLLHNGAAGGSSEASQLTVVLNDTAFKKIRVIAMEPSLGYAGHSPSGIGVSGPIDAFVLAYTTMTDPDCPFEWVKSRGDRYILSSGACRGATLDTNDKLRRARGLA